MSQWFARVRRLFGNDRKEAWRAEVVQVREAAHVPGVDPRFEAEAQAPADKMTLTLGRAVLRPDLPVRLALDDLLGRGHGLVTGATGTGKTFLMLHILANALRRVAYDPAALGVWVIEHKSELVPLVRELIAGLVAELPPALGKVLLDGLVVIDPFAKDALVPFNLLRPDVGVPAELHAWEVASLVNRVGGSEMGTRQDAFLFHAVLLAIATNRTLPELANLMDDPVAFLAQAESSPSERVRSFFRGGLKVSGTSLDGVRARVTRLLRLPSMRLQLGAKEGLSFPELLADKIVLIDLGSPPQGCEDIARFWAGLVSAKFARAVFARSHADASRPVLVVVDEWAEGLQGEGDVAGDYEKLLTMARSRGVSMILGSQSLAGASKVSTVLPRVVATNTAWHWVFRASPEDARLLAHMLPISGREPRPCGAPWEEAPRSPFLTAAEERELKIHEVSRLPDRTCWYWDRRRPYPAVLMRTNDVVLPPPGFRSVALTERLRNGTLAKPIKELEAALAPKVNPVFRALATPAALPTTTPPPAPLPPGVILRRKRTRRR